MRYPRSGPPPPRLRAIADLRAAEEEREAAGVPLASRSATRVSARSTLTSTCFFNVIQSFGIGASRAPGGWAPVMRAPDGRARGPWVRTNPTGSRPIHGADLGARAHQ